MSPFLPNGKWCEGFQGQSQIRSRFGPHSKRPLLPRRQRRRLLRNRVPRTPYNTTSYLMRAGKLGINAPLLSPATPTLVTPVVSPSLWPTESLGECHGANELGVNVYGSMNGRIQLREDEFDRSSCGESGVEHGSHFAANSPNSALQQVEERIDHGLQRFEFKADSPGRKSCHAAADHEFLIIQLEEENSCLQQRLWAMSQELTQLRRRLSDENEAKVVSDESLDVISCAS